VDSTKAKQKNGISGACLHFANVPTVYIGASFQFSKKDERHSLYLLCLRDTPKDVALPVGNTQINQHFIRRLFSHLNQVSL